ncbi:MAG: hypothetical protein SOY95_08220 [Atopobiaceae bacterium]|nr:hypothetical protein [Atopobiaceae bacterium]
MILDRSELKLFHAAMALIEFEGNKRLHIVPYSIKYEPPAPDDEAELLDAIFHSPEVLKDIAEHLPPQTPRKVADLIQSWQHPLTGKFTVVQLGPEPLFLGFDRAFAVAGITHSIASVVGKFPAAVDTVLLPFGRFIVYDAYLQTYDMGFSERMKAMFADEAARCKKEGLIVRDGRELAKNAESWMEDAHRHLEEHERRQKELEEKDEMPEGCHRGALAGLAPDERERAAKAASDAAFDRADASSADELRMKLLGKLSKKGQPVHALAEQLSCLSKARLQELGRALDLTRLSKLRKDELVQLVAEALEQNPRFDEVLSICFPEEFKAVRDAVAAGGVKEFDLEDPRELHAACRMPELVGLGMLFVSGTKASFALSDLFMSQAPSLDWDGIEARVQQGQRIFDHIGAAVYLRGIMLALDANDEFGEGLSGNEVIDIIARYMQAGYAGFAIMSFEGDPDELYLVDGSLCDSCYPPDGDSEWTEGLLLDQEMDPLIEDILDGQQGKEPRPLPEGVENDADVEEWMLRIPEVQELRSYLDAHVPDDADDYFFADDVIEEFLYDMRFGMSGTNSIQHYLNILDEYGFVPTEAVLTQLLNRIMKMMNAVPIWPNNGWSPIELFHRNPEKDSDIQIDTTRIV